MRRGRTPAKEDDGKISRFAVCIDQISVRNFWYIDDAAALRCPLLLRTMMESKKCQKYIEPEPAKPVYPPYLVFFTPLYCTHQQSVRFFFFSQITRISEKSVYLHNPKHTAKSAVVRSIREAYLYMQFRLREACTLSHSPDDFNRTERIPAGGGCWVIGFAIYLCRPSRSVVVD